MSESSYTCLQVSVHQFGRSTRWEAEIRAYSTHDRQWVELARWDVDGDVLSPEVQAEIVTGLDVFLAAFGRSTGLQLELPFT